MIRLNRCLLALLVILVVFASMGVVLSADSGSGSVVAGDDTSDGSVGYGNDSNTGSADSLDDENEDPLDEEYYGQDAATGNGNGNEYNVSLSKYPTANPLFALFLALISICGLWIKR